MLRNIRCGCKEKRRKEMKEKDIKILEAYGRIINKINEGRTITPKIIRSNYGKLNRSFSDFINIMAEMKGKDHSDIKFDSMAEQIRGNIDDMMEILMKINK